ncbi:MAG TPA: LysM peptidoglycan-binding domain-containing protein, partial [Anaerolineales bacterium]|nr:LysM peptidoglycan-binding domain-containing protein [Anaerolineales bacterium]
MNTKKFLQSLILISLLLALFASASPALAAGCGTSVTVISGDTLRKIADRCVTTISALRRANPEIGSGDLIYPGQVLLLPGAIINGNSGYNTYIVMRGDTLRLLANRFGTTIDTLVSLNTNIVNVNLIYEGQRLVVPSGQGVPVPPPPTGGQVYYVQSGDTLRKIAAKFSTTVDAILKANPQ